MDAQIDTMMPYMMTSSVPILLNFGQPIRRPDTPIQPIRAHIQTNGFFFVGVGVGAEISTSH